MYLLIYKGLIYYGNRWRESRGQTFSPKASGLAACTWKCWTIRLFFSPPAFQSSQFSLLILSLSLHQMTTLPHFLKAKHQWNSRAQHSENVQHSSFCLLSARQEYSWKNVILKKKNYIFYLYLTHRQFSSWMDQLCKANLARRQILSKIAWETNRRKAILPMIL